MATIGIIEGRSKFYGNPYCLVSLQTGGHLQTPNRTTLTVVGFGDEAAFVRPTCNVTLSQV